MSEGQQPPDDVAVRTLAEGRYLLEERLGRGGAAEVWRARDTVLDIDRAIKLLIGEGEGRQTLRRRLRDEARAMARLQHPHILQIYDIGLDQGREYIVMDLADGGTLADLLHEHGPLPPDLVVDYGLQVLSALAAAHAAGIVHRDVKPQNVLLDRDGKAMLADFGIALLSEDVHRRTRTGVAMGSLAYMAPEQRLDARSVGQAADIYSLGTSLYHLLSGDNPVDLFAADEGSTRWEALPQGLREAIYRATRYEPADRFATARDMAMVLLVLRGVVGSEPLRKPTPTDPVTWSAPSARLSVPSSETVHEATRFAATWFDQTFDQVVAGQEELAARIAALIPEGPAHAGPTIMPEPAGATLVAMDHRPRRFWLVPVVLLVVLVSVGVATLGPMLSRMAEGPDPVPAEPAPEVSSTTLVEPEPRAEIEPAALEPTGEAALDPEVDDGVVEVVLPPEPTNATAPALGPPPMGTWVGSLNGREFELTLRGTPDAIFGDSTTRFLGNPVKTEVRGRFDAASRELVLEDQGDYADAGTYRAILTENLTRMDGTLATRDNTVLFTARIVR